MKLNPSALAKASGVATAIIWTVCSLLVLAFPSMISDMTGHMLHAQLESFTWMLTFTGYIVGLIAWSAWAALTGSLIAVIYNKVVPD